MIFHEYMSDFARFKKVLLSLISPILYYIICTQIIDLRLQIPYNSTVTHICLETTGALRRQAERPQMMPP